MKQGTLYGLGLGPGDPDLMTVRAHRLLGSTRQIAFFRKAGRPGQSRQIVDTVLGDDAIEHPMEYPVTTEIPVRDPRYKKALSAFYEECTAYLRKLVDGGEDVIVLCEGDPFFYGSFMHLYVRLKDDVPIEVVPAVTGMSAAWTATGQPIAWGDDVLCVLMGTLPEDVLVGHMEKSDALVIMKLGRNFKKVHRALRSANRHDDAWLIEYASMPAQSVRRLCDAECDDAPYFSVIVVHGRGRRP